VQWLHVLLVALDMVAKWWRSRYRPRRRMTRVWVLGVRLDFEYTRREGFRLVAWARMVDGSRGRHAVVQETFVVPKKPDQVESSPGEVRKVLPLPKSLAKLPTLASYILDMDYEEGGGPRKPSNWLVTPTVLGWQITFKDPTTCRQLRLTVSDLDTAFASLEALLAGPSCPWEPDEWAAKRQAQGGKKK